MTIAFITLTNDGYIEYTLNCLQSLLQQKYEENKIPELNCYCIGKKSYNALKTKTTSYLIDDDANSNFQIFRKGNWSDITFYKFHIIYENLQKYDYVCFTDGDIVYESLKFIPYCLEKINDYELLIQNDTLQEQNNKSIRLCTGFMFIKSNENTKQIFNPANISKELVGWDDQIYINNIKNKLKFKLLPLDLFPNGGYYYLHHNKINPYIIHFNYLIGHNKKNKMKEYKKWFIQN